MVKRIYIYILLLNFVNPCSKIFELGNYYIRKSVICRVSCVYTCVFIHNIMVRFIINAPSISKFTRAYLYYELYSAFIWEYSCLLICLQNTLFAAFVPILLNYGQSATNYLFRKYLLYRVLFAYSLLYLYTKCFNALSSNVILSQ